MEETLDGQGSFYKYTGVELDKESGLAYHSARYYDNVVGRFVSVDPLFVEVGSVGEDFQDRFVLNPQEGSVYSYSLNGPVVFVDPEGQAAWGVNIGIGGTFSKKGQAGAKGQTAIAFIFDSKGNFNIIRTRDVGVGSGKAIGGFANVVVGLPDTYAADYEGTGLSVSASGKRFNVAATVPLNGNKTLNITSDRNAVFIEAGVVLGRGKEAGITFSHGERLFKTDIFGKVGNWLGKKAYELTHENKTYEFPSEYKP